MSYVGDVHRRFLEGFRTNGNEAYPEVGHCDVSLEEFLESIVKRHSQRDESTEYRDGYTPNEEL